VTGSRRVTFSHDGPGRRQVGRWALLSAVGSVALVDACSPAAAGTPLLQGLPPTDGRSDRSTAPARPGLADRALADLLRLQGPFPAVADPAGRYPVSAGLTGAAIAAWAPYWRYVWPRDASFAAAALARAGHAGHPAAGAQVMDFLTRIAPTDGHWQARYLPDGSGRVPDDRGVQSDGAGWVCWAVWSQRAATGIATPPRWWPMVRASAEAMATSLGPAGQPPESSDYWELAPDGVTLETMTAHLVGLRAAAAVARELDRAAQASRWSQAAGSVAAALRSRWSGAGYPRTLGHGGADAAVGLLATLAPDLPGLPGAVAAAGRELVLPNGGARPGAHWPHRDGIAWTPEVGMLALGSARFDPAAASCWLRWLDTHRTTAGALPEKVTADGSPASVAPLGWTCALVLLTLAAARAPLAPPIS